MANEVTPCQPALMESLPEITDGYQVARRRTIEFSSSTAQKAKLLKASQRAKSDPDRILILIIPCKGGA
jgi:hypothetical protein